MSQILLEACCGSVQEALAAERAGADRIELCAALPTGGVTPSIGMLEEVRDCVSVPIVAMVRPREGGACPPEEDFRAAVRDVRHCVRAGADQVVCGVLDERGRVDTGRNRALIDAAEGRRVAFHRVFDMAEDLYAALDALAGLGFCRVLTSGGADTVDAGMETLAGLVRHSGGRVTVLAGGGVRPHNAAKLVMECGCRELHFSVRKETGAGYGGASEFQPVAGRVAEIRAAVQSLGPPADVSSGP